MPGKAGGGGHDADPIPLFNPEKQGAVKGTLCPAAPACGRPAHPRRRPSPARGRAPQPAKGERSRRWAPPVRASPGREGEEATEGSDPDSVPASGVGAGEPRDIRGGNGEGARGESRKCSHPESSPWLLNRPFLSLGPWGGGLGTAREAGVPSLLFSFSPPSPFLTRTSSPFPFPAAARGRLGATPAGAGVAYRLPQANFVQFRVSLLCKLQEMGGVGDPWPPRTFPEPGCPGRSLAPSLSPREGEGPREQKPRHPALAGPGRGG